MKQLIALLLFVPSLCLAQSEGCTYVDADNYDPDALNDDGSCTFQEGTYHHPTTISTAIFDPCGNDGLLRDEPAYSTSWTTEQYKEALTQHIEDEGYGKVLILSMEHAIVNPEFDGYGLDWTSNQTIGNEWNVSCAYSAYLTEWIPSITVAFTDPCILAACAGCMDSTALNFSNQANEDDGSCIFADELCGEGTVWDNSTSTCVVAYPSDVDLDGCTGVGDVLNVLANFGGCYPDDDDAWTCGDPLTFWNYNYQTALIGNDCWMAENLQTDRFANGDFLPLNVDNATSYALGEEGEVSAGFPGESVTNKDVFGLMYNWYAVHDCRNLCPEGWHVSTQLDWSHFLSIHGPEYIAGNRAKASPTDNPGWDGSNLSGLSVIPAGGIFNGSSTTFYPGIYAYLHIAGLSDQPVSTYRMQTGNSNLFVSYNDWADLKSVRCVTDSDLSSPYCRGCTDPDACNYDSTANINDNSCNYDCYGCLDPNYIEYSPEILFDNGNCLHLIDNECQSFEWDNHQYGVVQIGGQCWLSENLRTTIYANGDSIQTGLTVNLFTTTSGATMVYGDSNLGCYNYSPDIDACDVSQSLAEYGRLYNGYAGMDSRGLCPSGWHVPTDGEWTVLEDYITSQGFSGTENTALKSAYGWANSGNGTDDFEFSALPGGLRDQVDGYDHSAGFRCYWWSSTNNGDNIWLRDLRYNNSEILRYDSNPRSGLSVRCLRDSE